MVRIAVGLSVLCVSSTTLNFWVGLLISTWESKGYGLVASFRSVIKCAIGYPEGWDHKKKGGNHITERDRNLVFPDISPHGYTMGIGLERQAQGDYVHVGDAVIEANGNE